MKNEPTAITAACEFRGGTRDIVTVPLKMVKPIMDHANRLIVQERPADLISTPYFEYDATFGVLTQPAAVERAIDAMYPGLCVQN